MKPAFQTMSAHQGLVDPASTPTCSMSAPIMRLKSTLTPLGKGGIGFEESPGSILLMCSMA